ncbi:hypothetical protein CKO_02949 [Citrobacter koseri ATCC BAA-895]|uniref:Uncharacterized protein n=1 Tax=Citrobacter koseri (strain ATCC BAA-895 / CDC 4225-83 / SGSC4696) TaxID=290338 RepID=A8AKP2_CITK8|nr:hypothetical protein CKO_02949 [Citrobacter koseri ATCC BAA-895]
MGFNISMVLRHNINEPLKALAFSAWIFHYSIIAINDDIKLLSRSLYLSSCS